MEYLVDSNIIIYHLNGDIIATDFIKKNIENISISIITYIEVLSFKLSKYEFENIVKLLNKFNIIDIDMLIANQALKNRSLKKIKIPDNLIASTSQIYNKILVTRNTADFNHLDLQLLNIFD